MELYTIPEAAAATRMSPAWFRKMIFQKEIRHLKIGRRVFIEKKTIEDLLNQAVVERKPPKE